MSLDSCIESDLVISHISFYETLLNTFCDLLGDKSLLQETTSVQFVLKALLASAQSIETLTASEKPQKQLTSYSLSEVAINLVIVYCLAQLA